MSPFSRLSLIYYNDFKDPISIGPGPGFFVPEKQLPRRGQFVAGAGRERLRGQSTSSATKGTVANFMACSTDCAVDATTNRISNWRYDAAGNPIGISTSTLQWDGAGRLESIDSGATASYSYDHLGRRILKRAPSDNTQYFYDVTGKVLWEFDPDGTGDHQKMVRAYFNGRLFTSTGDAAAGSHTVYTDHLGTPRLKLHVMTAASEARDDYYPFGQQVNTVVDAAHDRRFTGKERDAESGLDYFGARYYHSTAGRFLSVDPVLDSADPINPQSWNRYAYTFNNPLKYVDKTGEIVDLAWDFLSLAWGVKSLIENVSAGNYGWAAVDALGVAVDAVAAAVPIVPGGAGAVIKGARLVDKVDNVGDVSKNVFEIAQRGGKHSGFLKNYLGRSQKEIQKA